MADPKTDNRRPSDRILTYHQDLIKFTLSGGRFDCEVQMKSKLVQYARRHAYQLAEGFIPDDTLKFELSAEVAEMLKENSAFLATAADIPPAIAESALVSYVLERYFIGL